MIFVNFKTYKESSGPEAVRLATMLEAVSNDQSVPIIPVLQALDIKSVATVTEFPLWIQHIDAVTYGAHTGSILPENAILAGIEGTFLNHSEHKIVDPQILENTVKRAHEVGLKTLVFAADLEELARVLNYRPTYVSYEPPQFIGSTKVSVSEAEPDIIEKAAKLTKEAGIPLIVGAGIHSEEDIRTSLKLGAFGFAIATNIVKSEDPEGELYNLLKGFDK